MELNELIEKKKNIESELTDSISRLVSKFYEETRIPIESIHIYIQDVYTFGNEYRNSVIAGVSVSLKI
jgi:hypothetical protein